MPIQELYIWCDGDAAKLDFLKIRTSVRSKVVKYIVYIELGSSKILMSEKQSMVSRHTVTLTS